MNFLLLRRLSLLAILLTLALPSLTHAATLIVKVVPDGSGQYMRIQDAVNAAHNGDTVLVGDGTYTGDGNRDIDFLGKNITVFSQNGPTKTIIDCGDSSGVNHRGFYLHNGEISSRVVAQQQKRFPLQ